MVKTSLADISKFLTEDVIDNAFKIRTNSKDSVKSIEVTRAAAAGEGLLSAVYRIHAKGSKSSTCFVVKGLVSDPLLRKTLECTKYFKREADFFSNILPVLCEVQTSLNATESVQNNIPICYGCHQDGLNDYILLEDLSETNCDSVSETPTKLEKDGVLKTMAHLHAVSMVLRLQKPEEFTKIANSLPELYFKEENRDWYAPYLKNAIDIDRKIVTEFENADSIYLKKFNELLSNDVYGQDISLVSTWGEHPVLCHGDAWSPNFLQSPDRTVSIDFQFFRCASPATDLAYWIMLCSNHTTEKHDFIDAVDTYYTAIEHYLKDMGFDASKVFSRDALDQELKLYGRYGFLACLTSFSLMSADKCDVLNFMVDKYSEVERIPLECLWQIFPIEKTEHKIRILNALRVAVEVGLL